MFSCYCGSTKYFQFQTKDYLYSAKNSFIYNVCESCNSHYLLSNTKFENNYNSEYYSLTNRTSIQTNIFRAIRYTSTSILADILRFIKPLSVYDEYVAKYLRTQKVNILDFGSGTSSYIEFLKKINLISGSAYSYDPYSLDKKTLTDFNNIPFDKIDLIISNQVLEHLQSPKQLLDEMYLSSKANCEFIFSVPVVGTVLSLFQQYSYTLQAPDHLSILSLHGWLKLLTKTKWKVKSIVEDERSTLAYIKKSNKIFSKNTETSFDIEIKNKPLIVDNIIFHLEK